MQRHHVHRTVSARIPTQFGQFQLVHYVNDSDAKEHLAIVYGDISGRQHTLVRVHSECFTGDVLGSERCDCGQQLAAALAAIEEAGAGVVIYLRQEGRGIGLQQKLAAYNLQDEGLDTVDANLALGHQADEREYWAAAAILDDLNVPSIRLMTNNPLKIESLHQLGVQISERLPLEVAETAESSHYLRTKAQRMRHLLTFGNNGAYDPNDSPLEDVSEQLAHLQSCMREHAQRSRRPFVTVSYAQTLDGSIAHADGKPLAVSGESSLVITHRLRAQHDAILVGIGTVLADDPQLTVRLVQGPHPQPIVLDSTLRISPNARIFENPRGLWIATSSQDVAKRNALQERGARILDIRSDEHGMLELTHLLALLAQSGIDTIMVEGGTQVISSFLSSSCIDYLVVTIAPRYTTGRRVITEHRSMHAQALPRLHNHATVSLDGDIMLWATPALHRAQA